MKLLYVSVHAILEYDELKLLEELGVDYFALGSYINPRKPVDLIRPALTKEVATELYHNAPLRENMPSEFLQQFDTILFMDGEPVPMWITNAWEKMKNKRVVWRTIGQSTPAREAQMKVFRDLGMQIIRYSPLEAKIENYIGCDKIIRFYKDPEEFGNWNGNKQEVINFTQNMKVRDDFCNYQTARYILSKVKNGHVYGTKNGDLGALNGGFLTYDGLKAKMRDSRVYFYSGTQPASYTLNFVEAMMTGIPIVALGNSYYDITRRITGDVYEVPHIIENGVNGYVSDDKEEIIAKLNMLLDNYSHAKELGDRGRQKAIELFGKETIKAQWKEFLGL